MDYIDNPFTPSFGQVPPFLAGRADIVSDMRRAFRRGPGDPNLSTIFIGARGTGKTALMTYLCEEALEFGWISARVTAKPGMLEDIIERTLDAAAQFVSQPDAKRLTGVSVGKIIDVTWEYRDEKRGNWRTRMTRLLDELAEHDVGLIVAVDEVRADLDEMIELASVYQHFVGERRRIALMMAGLPSNVSALINDKTVSFLRRAFSHKLGRVSDGDVEGALAKTALSAGRKFDPPALALAVRAIDGFPYMMQLVGYRAWDQNLSSEAITLENVEAAVGIAKQEMFERIYEATYYELSEGDRRLLAAMLEDEKASRLSDLAKRMGETNGYAGVYKKRLMESGVIAERGRGVVAFELPGFREYLEEKMLDLLE